MKFNHFLTSTRFGFLAIAIFSAFALSSCKKDETPLAETSFEYKIHNGQAVPTAAYRGTHNSDFSVMMDLKEMDNGNTMVSLTLKNTIDGAAYHIHSHDAADAGNTPNGTPYDETPNADVFAQMVTGNGGDVTVSQEALRSFTELTTEYAGFFVVHDPLQDLSTTDITTYLVVGAMARAQADPGYQSSTYAYDFNTGQIAPQFAYSGTHSNTLSATITVDELAGETSRIVVRVANAIDGETYHTHAHDAADPGTTPNGTPYDEAPNLSVFANALVAAGTSAAEVNISTRSYSAITTSYEGYFVIHDPLQAVTTTDPTTYVVLGLFAR